MKKQVFVLMMVVLLMAPVGAMAMKGMDHGDSGKNESMDHDMKNMDHGSMDMGGKMIMLGDVEVDGVMGSAHLMDVKEKMAKHGMDMTHHIMINFMDTEGNPVEKGSAAVKVEDPQKKEGKAMKMMGMKGGFGVDLKLDQKGMYNFKVGTKLADGQKRTFQFHFEKQ